MKLSIIQSGIMDSLKNILLLIINNNKNTKLSKKHSGITDSLKKILPKCPLCNSTKHTQHQLSCFSHVSALNINEVENLNQLITNRDWRSIVNLQSGKMTDDILELDILKCMTGKYIFVKLLSPFELFRRDELESIIPLEDEEQDLVCELTKSKWYELD